VAPKPSLLRFVAVGGALVADPPARRPGRGAYSCRSQACFERALRRGGFNRAFRQAVTAPPGGENVHLSEIYE
jgi:predicted RNA-binding protein YlxR (DUF448 family)